MFVSLLNDEQQVALAGCVHAVAAVDGQVDQVEAELLDALARDGAALAAVEVGEAADLESLKETTAAAFADEPPSGPAARAFIAEVAGMITIDGQETADELAILAALMEVVGVDAAEAEAFLDFGRRAGALAQEGTDLVLADGIS